ncbi:uncharacterized protein A4U43_C05F11440 [Asparagus officinalis]|uniref:Uncharacterized protein n=1 Tax=Asparagus officinalis TaxID=4686 RepID=A0A5P1EQZ0_ASPOF|nr:uncharacterized protein A4U43_C05F11440 [Asparagus officinalis]
MPVSSDWRQRRPALVCLDVADGRRRWGGDEWDQRGATLCRGEEAKVHGGRRGRNKLVPPSHARVGGGIITSSSSSSSDSHSVIDSSPDGGKLEFSASGSIVHGVVDGWILRQLEVSAPA